ncbi:MAG: hypothetical protein CSA39_04370 [Flavobacteriales bacterium]|nr:MAG: hypothetical protein CSA39_04370 [Flavobacteriales bacterium]
MKWSDKKIVYFFTGTYPYGTIETFIENEIIYLSNVFDKVIIVPTTSTKQRRKLPSNVIVDDGLSEMFRKKNRKLKNFFTFSTLKALLYDWKYLHSIAAIRRINSFGSDAKQAYNWLKKNEVNNALVYTYWLNGKTHGALNYKLKLQKNIKVISRAHGYDLYNYRHNPSFWPYRQKTLQLIDRLYVISLDGKKYLELNYKTKNNIVVSRLGVVDKGTLGETSKDNILRILSIANFNKVKRIPLLYENLLKYAIDNPNARFQWIHFGSGDGMEDLKKKIESNNIDNLHVDLKGRVSNKFIYDYLSKEPIDVFINVSESEGLPVSIMEVQSFGKFVIATNVGGSKEMIFKGLGYLLDKNFSYKDFKQAIDYFNSNLFMIQKKAPQIRGKCLQAYDGSKNFNMFANDILNLLDE